MTDPPVPRLAPRCTVRGCALLLALEGRSWRCPNGHAFDVARSGYVNLLQPQDRRSPRAGDSREAVEARARLEDRGIGAELIAAIVAEARRLEVSRDAAALDVGAGTGRLLAELRAALEIEAWALDLSPHAAERCARRPGVHGVVANADRGLPFADSAFTLVVSCTGPRPFAELARALAPNGVLLVAVPAPEDLVELREAAQGEGRLVDRVPKLLEELSPRFALERRETVRARRLLDRAALDDLLAATYRGARRSERERLGALGELEVTMAAELLTLRPT